jgi:hypothetical protein
LQEKQDSLQVELGRLTPRFTPTGFGNCLSGSSVDALSLQEVVRDVQRWLDSLRIRHRKAQ